MRRLITVIATLSLLASGACAKSPNVIFLIVDDLKPEISAYDGQVHTPAIDTLAASGTTFLNAHCQQAVCGPSRASVLTGLSPDHTQVWDQKTKIRDKLPNVVTLPEYFKENGYTSIGVGKVYSSGSVDKGRDTASWSRPYLRNWELEYDAEYGMPKSQYQGEDIRELENEAAAQGITHWRDLAKYMAEHDAKPPFEAAEVPDDAYADGAIANFALSSLDQLAKEEQPFFLAIGFGKPHLPFVAPKKYWDMIDAEQIAVAPFQEHALGSPSYAWDHWPELRAYSSIPSEGPLPLELQRKLIHGYYACVAYIDAQIAKILDKIKELRLENDTIIVLWGDHGWHLGDHGQWSKHTNYEQATRVPLIIVAPGIPGGRETAQPVALLDIYPSLCQLAGLPIPGDLDGFSLMPLLKDPDNTTRKFVMSQYPKGNKMGYSMRSVRYRYTGWYDTGASRIADGTQTPTDIELYDYAVDPLEKRNLVNDPAYQEILKKLQAEMANYLKHQNGI